MNETLKHIKERFSCRDFANVMPTDAQLSAVAQAAIEAPSGMNRQLWQVIVVKNKTLVDELEREAAQNLYHMDKAFHDHIMARGKGLFYGAPCMLLLAIKQATPPGAELIDLGICAQNAVLAATSLGLASLHCGIAGLAFAGKKASEFKRRLRFPEGYECGMAVLLGQANTPSEPHTPDPGKITVIE